ncbi:MAG TPA: hypothetical protein VKB18_07645 [Gemmatimonadota bacterium]|nr:hypothetical protein [Gemmatimonadota bacterium]
MSGLAGWVAIVAVVLALNRILSAAVRSGRRGEASGTPPGRSGAGGSRPGRTPATPGRMRATPERLEGGAFEELLGAVDAALGGRPPVRTGPGSSPRPRARFPGRRPELPDPESLWMPEAVGGAALEPASRPAAPAGPRSSGHGLGAEKGARPASGAGPAEPKAPDAAAERPSARRAAGLPDLPGRSRLQRAVLWAEVLGPPVSMRRPGGGPL